VRADAFCTAIPDALRPGGATPTHTGDASFLWQHGRCATHTLQLSVRAGLATPTLGSILKKVRLVAKLCRNSTNSSEALRVSVEREDDLLAAAAEREPVTATKLVSRLIIKLPDALGVDAGHGAPLRARGRCHPPRAVCLLPPCRCQQFQDAGPMPQQHGAGSIVADH